MKYEVKVRQILVTTVEVEADSPAEAEQVVENLWSEVGFDIDDVEDVQFEVVKGGN